MPILRSSHDRAPSFEDPPPSGPIDIPIPINVLGTRRQSRVEFDIENRTMSLPINVFGVRRHPLSLSVRQKTMYINGIPASYVYHTVGPVLATAPALLILRNERSWSRPRYWGKSLAIGALVWAGVNVGHGAMAAVWWARNFDERVRGVREAKWWPQRWSGRDQEE